MFLPVIESVNQQCLFLFWKQISSSCRKLCDWNSFWLAQRPFWNITDLLINANLVLLVWANLIPQLWWDFLSGMGAFDMQTVGEIKRQTSLKGERWPLNCLPPEPVSLRAAIKITCQSNKQANMIPPSSPRFLLINRDETMSFRTQGGLSKVLCWFI